MLESGDKKRLSEVSETLYSISRQVRILGYLSWPKAARYTFFRSGSQKLPEVEYPRFDSTEIKKRLRLARKELGDLPQEKWLLKKSRDLEA